MKRRALLLTGALGATVAAAGGAGWWRTRAWAGVPARFRGDLPEQCRQVLLVTSPAPESVPATLRCLEKGAFGRWRDALPPVPVTLGRSGLAWGRGEHRGGPPSGFRAKREGDGCSPAGVFRLPFAFGGAGDAPGVKLPYRRMTDAMAGVDDSHSAHYNEVVDSRVVTPDWTSAEVMNRPDGLYSLGAFVAHNPERTPQAGSCIFLHVWSGPGKPTSGCTAMALPDLERVLRWVDPAAEPRLVQWVAE